jgi:hypothetical protein
MGRYAISKKAGLSNAKVRAILENLKDDDLAVSGGQNSGRKGTSLTLTGQQLLMRINGIISTIFKDEASISSKFLGYNYPYHCLIFAPINHLNDNNINTLEIRDETVRNGAQGAVVLVWDENLQSYIFPEKTSDSQVNERKFEPFGENDEIPIYLVDERCQKGLLIITFGHDEGKTNLGGLAAVTEIYKNELKFLKPYFDKYIEI